MLLPNPSAQAELMFDNPTTYQVIVSARHALCGQHLDMSIHGVYTADQVKETFRHPINTTIYCHHCLVDVSPTHVQVVKMYGTRAEIVINTTDLKVVQFDESVLRPNRRLQPDALHE